MEKIFLGILWYLAFLLSTTLHEAAHAFTALKLGDQTAYLGGQVTLSPIPHIRREPVGTVIIPIVSYLLGGWMMGWASAPYNFEWAFQYPKRSAIMSIAGPAANLLLVVCAAAMVHLGLAAGVFYPPESISFTHIVASTEPGFFVGVADFVSILFSLNLLLCLFNLLPFPPLDGSGAVALVISDDLSRRYMIFLRKSSLSFIGLLLAWNLFGYVYGPIHLLVINLLYPGIHYG